jgi:hypothetical protein
MKTHLHVVGVIDLITGLFFAVVGLLVSLRVLLFAPLFTGGALWQQEEGVAALAIWLFISGVLVALGIPSLIAGIGLLKQKGWARTLAIVLAVLALVSFPVGTAAGVYTLWVLTHRETEQLLSTAV